MDILKSSALTLQRQTGSLQLLQPLDEKIISYIQKICKRDPRTGKVVTGGIVSCKDSSWLLSWTINRQGQFKAQKKDEDLCMGIQPVYRCSRRLYQEAHERVYR